MMTQAQPVKRWRMLRASRTVAVATACALVAGSLPVTAPAQDIPKGLPIIRDSETEQLLRDYTQPILRAAGLTQQNIRVVIINDRAFNAFVIDAKRIFVNAGALMQAKTPNQIIGVFAHETGHIAGGHLAKMRNELANAQTAMIIGLLLGVGAVAAGAGSKQVGGNPAAALMAPQMMVMRSLLAYQRAQEEQADRAGVKFLNATGQSTKGMYETFKKFADEQLFATQYADPYLQSHPMPTERIAALEEIAKTSPYWNKTDPAELQARHDLMRAKLYGFMEKPDAVMRRYPSTDTSLPARYARAISAYRHSDMRSAIAEIDSLIQTQPNNPYFHELKGQALLEAGRAAEAVAPLRRALSLAPNPSLIQVMLGQALIASNQAGAADEAINDLRAAVTHDPDIADGYDYLAMAYGRKNDLAQADLASAQAAFTRGQWGTARQLAARAKTRFPVGAPGWVKADDIASYKPPRAAGFFGQ
jgi:predicted Zn-dependent protease